MNVLNRIWAPHGSRRVVFLICLLIGIFASGGLQSELEGSVFVVGIAPALPGYDSSYEYPFDPATGRELSSYAQGGHIGECSWKEGKESRTCLRGREQARKFIYDHWHSKQRAYIAIDFPCVDCAPTMHVFIEPNDANEWHLTIVHEEPLYPPRRWPDAFDVVYRQANEYDRWREQTKRVLSFRDLSGTEIDSF